MSADWPKKRACSDNYRFFIHRVPWTCSGYTTASNSVKLFPKSVNNTYQSHTMRLCRQEIKENWNVGWRWKNIRHFCSSTDSRKTLSNHHGVNKTAKNFRLNGLEKKKIAKTYTSLIVVDVPYNRDSGGIHLMGRRALKLGNGKDIWKEQCYENWNNIQLNIIFRRTYSRGSTK